MRFNLLKPSEVGVVVSTLEKRNQRLHRPPPSRGRGGGRGLSGPCGKNRIRGRSLQAVGSGSREGMVMGL